MKLFLIYFTSSKKKIIITPVASEQQESRASTNALKRISFIFLNSACLYCVRQRADKGDGAEGSSYVGAAEENEGNL